MGFGMGQYAATLFGEAGWPAFRFFTDDTAAHMFARLPVGPAIRWLEAQSSKNPTTLIDFAAERLAKNGYRDAIAALEPRPHAQARRRPRSAGSDELSKSIDAKAASGAAKYLPLIRERQGRVWIDGFLAFRDDFEFARRAAKGHGRLRRAAQEPRMRRPRKPSARPASSSSKASKTKATPSTRRSSRKTTPRRSTASSSDRSTSESRAIASGSPPARRELRRQKRDDVAHGRVAQHRGQPDRHDRGAARPDLLRSRREVSPSIARSCRSRGSRLGPRRGPPRPRTCPSLVATV